MVLHILDMLNNMVVEPFDVAQDWRDKMPAL
jgi:hypothetical protein